jgi:CO/xanthine dehydrogenase Mo-binding subunit
VRIAVDCAIELFIGATDVGGGTGTSLGQILAEELSVSLSAIRVVIADTELTPFDHGTYSSRVTPYVGAAVKLAALDARRQVVAKAAQLWNLPIEQIRFADGKISADHHRPLALAALLAQSQTEQIVGVGTSQGKRLWAEDVSKQARDASAPGWPFGAQAVEVAVDRETGVIKLVRVASAHDVGKAINPMAVTGQIEGGIIMGVGYALSEGLLFDQGRITNASFADYKIPTIRDIPAATPIIFEKDYDSEPYGAKGVGEMSVFGIAPAIANAVARLTGVRIKDLPLSAEKLREQLKQAKDI